MVKRSLKLILICKIICLQDYLLIKILIWQLSSLSQMLMMKLLFLKTRVIFMDYNNFTVQNWLILSSSATYQLFYREVPKFWNWEHPNSGFGTVWVCSSGSRSKSNTELFYHRYSLIFLLKVFWMRKDII